ncbi:MAG TPA: heavy metal-binding domain-containing protein, partial [Usitatibacter sp.]|nr:heavy metal-binding domain-containing protein [Usitatibacter sp.]
MSHHRFVVPVVAIVFAAAGGAGGIWWAHHSMSSGSVSATPEPGRKVLYWHDPMYPQQKFDKPGKSPFMDMQLVPVYAGGGADSSGVKVDAHLAQNLGVRT